MTVPEAGIRRLASATAGRFPVAYCEGPAPALVEPPEAALAFRVCSVTQPALVLGSTQPADTVDEGAAAARGVEICRRRTGGGAVFVEPGAQLWFDAFVPAGDRLFETDVGRAFAWLGGAVARAVSAVTGQGAELHAGPPLRSRWSGLLCLAGVGSGEVLVSGRKVLGAAQRRDRRGAWFQAMLILRFEPFASVDLLALPEPARREAAAELASSAGVVGAGAEELAEALLSEVARL